MFYIISQQLSLLGAKCYYVVPKMFKADQCSTVPAAAERRRTCQTAAAFLTRAAERTPSEKTHHRRRPTINAEVSREVSRLYQRCLSFKQLFGVGEGDEYWGQDTEDEDTYNRLDSQYWHSWSALMDPSVCVLELLGIFFSLTAWLCSLTTTLMSCWLTLNTDLLPTESYQLGLWETCVVQELGVLECRPYDSLLGLPPDIRLARILMLATLATSLMGFTLAIPGIYVVNSCKGTETLKAKRTLKMMGGTLCLGAGILGLVPVSYVAHLTILKFFDETVPDVVPRWEFGDALFWGWGASFLHLAAGSLLVTSCLCLQGEPCPLPTSIPLQGGHIDPELSLRRRSEYV
ncbi:hypothetical protein AOLI_G00144100 [Acnodon oligacanthus]